MEIINIVSRVTFPAYSRIQGDLPRIKRWIEKSVSFMAYLYLPAITGLIIISPGILQYLYADKTEKWLPALPTLLLFLAGAFPIIVTTTYTNALYALGRPKVVLAFMAIYTVLTWGLGTPLIYKFGYVGIAMAGLIITYVTLPFVVRALNNLVPVETWNSVKKPLLASAIMGVVTYYVNLIFTHSLLTLIFTALFGVVTYTLAIITLDGPRLKSEIATYTSLIGHRNKI
ncbi:MAG: polysaccharide biosynthesis protein [uncultured bacterium]|nr:MAG: polysaccharide biosynthesis protein [uncultured bacterium]